MSHLLGIFPAAGGGIANALVGSSAFYPAGAALNRAAGGIYNIFHSCILLSVFGGGATGHGDAQLCQVFAHSAGGFVYKLKLAEGPV